MGSTESYEDQLIEFASKIAAALEQAVDAHFDKDKPFPKGAGVLLAQARSMRLLGEES
jgi:hypothetical protein